MLTELCAEVKNYFIQEIFFDTYKIKGGKIAPLDFLQNNQYFRIVGSVFNDGVYQNTADLTLTDEIFSGAVWAMIPPPDFIALATDIEKFCESGAADPSAYISESFGGYSYTKASGENGAPVTWRQVFASRLNTYRKACVL